MIGMAIRPRYGKLSDFQRALLSGFQGEAPMPTRPLEERYGDWMPDSLAMLLRYSGTDRQVWRRILLRIALYAALTLVAGLLLRSLLAPLVLAVGAGIEIFRLQRRAALRAESFERDYTALLLSLASAVRTGQDPWSALSHSHSLFSEESETRRQLIRFREATESGLPEEVALERFGADINHPDIALFRTAFLLARREGCSIAECLQRLAKVTRQRQSFRRKVRGAVAMQKLSALGIAGCVVLVGAFQWCANPEAVRQTLQHPLGQRLIAVGLLLLVTGVAWMLRMTRVRT